MRTTFRPSVDESASGKAVRNGLRRGKIPGSEPVAIGRLERFVADQNIPLETTVKPSVNKRVAVIGAGPAGLTAAADLAKEGFQLQSSPSIRRRCACLLWYSRIQTPKEIVAKKSNLKSLGVNSVSTRLSAERFHSKRSREYDAVFIGIGAGALRFMGIPGIESQQHIFLFRISHEDKPDEGSSSFRCTTHQ